MEQKAVRTAMIGCGGMARHHMKRLLQQRASTEVKVVSDPSQEAYLSMADIFKSEGLEPPPNLPDLDKLIESYKEELDAAFIITPHVYHFEQAKKLLEAGIDVLLEKPMVMNADEAAKLIDIQRQTNRVLVVAFNGSLSPQIREAARLLHSGELGEILTVHAVVWQNWKEMTMGKWRQVPEIAGGGFLFDTGAHMLNTVSDLIGEPFKEVAAFLDNRDTPVDILGAVMARTASGILVTLSGCGEAIKSCHSDVRIFCKEAIMRTDVWGKFLELQRADEENLKSVNVEESLGSWEQFLKVREGTLKNPCPPEVGLRMAHLWDAVKASAQQNGAVVKVKA